MILTLPAEFNALSNQKGEIEKDVVDLVGESPTTIKLEEGDELELEDNHHNKRGSSKITFNKPSKHMTQQLKPLYIKVYMEGNLMNRVLVDNGAVVNILPCSTLRKLSKLDNDMIPTNISKIKKQTVFPYSKQYTEQYNT